MPESPQGTTLVFGASGFLGAHLVAAAVARSRAFATFAEPAGPPVVGLCRTPELAPRFSQPRDLARWESLDLSVEGMLDAALARLAPAQVIFAAALARVADCEREPARAELLNAIVPERLARACQERGTRLVHVSTDLVFGGEDPPPGGFPESATPRPLSRYGHTKADGEMRVLAAHPGALVVRLPLLYGDSAGRGMGASDSLLAAVDRDERPPLFNDEFRTPLEVQNAARALLELLDAPASGILHVAGPERVSRFTLGLAVLDAMGLSPELARECVREARSADFPGPAPRPRDVSLDARRARALLRTPLLGVREGLARALR